MNLNETIKTLKPSLTEIEKALATARRRLEQDRRLALAEAHSGAREEFVKSVVRLEKHIIELELADLAIREQTA